MTNIFAIRYRTGHPVLIILLCLLSGYGSARQHTFAHFTEESGLPQNSVKFIVPDHNGFVWLATEDGLVRFDGKGFQTFNSGVLPLRSSRFNGLTVVNGQLYGINAREEVVHVNPRSSLPDSVFRPLPHPGQIYVQAQFSDTIIARNQPDPYYSRLPIRAYDLPLEQDSFYRCSGSHITLFTGGQPAGEFRPAGDSLLNYFTLSGKLHYRTGSTFYRLEGNTFTPALPTERLASLRNERCTCYWNSAARQLFLYAHKALYQLSYTRAGLLDAQLLISGFDCAAQQIAVVCRSQDGVLLLGSYTNGLFMGRPQLFGASGADDGRSTTYYAFAPWRDDHTVFAAGGTILDVPADGSAPARPVQVSIPGSSGEDKYAVLREHSGAYIWTKELRTLFRLDARTLRKVQQWTLPSAISQLYEDPGRTLYIATRSHGIYRLATERPDAAPAAAFPWPDDVTYMLRQGRLLYAATTDGLYAIDIGRSTARHIRTTAGLHVRSLLATGPDELWISTYDNGFFLLSGGRFIPMPRDDRKYLSSAHCILPDSNGYFWITTNKGLFQAAKADLLRYAAGQQQQVFYAYYNKYDGLPTNEFNGGCQPSGIRTGNGNFVFPSLNGAIYFRPEAVRPLLPANRVFIYRILANRLQYLSDTLALSRDNRRLHLLVTVPFFGNEKNLRLEYCFDNGSGSLQEWLPLPEDRTIHFERMPRGSHRLLVRKHNGFGLHNEEAAMLVISVPFLYHETWWFRLLLLLAAAGITMLFIRFRVKQIKQHSEALEATVTARTNDLEQMLQTLKQSEQELKWQTGLQEKIIAAITHDVKTPLKYVAVSAEHIEQLLARHAYDDAATLNQSIQSASVRIYHLIDSLVDYMKVNLKRGNTGLEAINLHELISGKMLIFSGIAGERKQFVNDVPSAARVQTSYQPLSIIVHNLLDNAAKHTVQGTIRATLEEDGNRLRLIISDTGTGLPEGIRTWLNGTGTRSHSSRSQGLGLIIVKEIAAMIGVAIEAYSTPDGGTAIHILFADGQANAPL